MRLEFNLERSGEATVYFQTRIYRKISALYPQLIILDKIIYRTLVR